MTATLKTRARQFAFAATMLGAATLSFAGASAAQATPFSFDLLPQSSDVGGADFTFDIQTPTSIVGDAILMLELDGDFNSISESARISIDGLDLGVIAVENTANDVFDFANNDDPDGGSRAGAPFWGRATISIADLAPLIVDGFVQLLVDTSARVDFSTTTVSGSLSFEAGNGQNPAFVQVPEPTVLSMVVLALLVSVVARPRIRRC